ncbi:MAG: 30S ribosomal protein S18 [Candidatus Portnoybacteria bacterium RIFCSPLOWO2_01_FULL_43_11]|uniref:Small ribosomal subunit protein bS18 n=3 Tax=Candidatus Portnoyibacteriota TaxID=1817913 RepID=A0A1G2FAB0_9BACT|nr:MAG: 30S ribosomal protein S18 [Candidatus Portnoybacteria bacterium RIFCSPHIGHO2_01_FULL_40_12b]OGZ36375.1 MAG: 30S ribosomal protein S18 [Candidatus Portnoybacteria bacterium RIFCSPHIGHO2_02_FULL_40_23]OGZ38518.1 MAG: 30S ribosomal protein S18 [Candidatus Portnoybacteria bacterium RIFCSPLOWO2_01_FULL_43_11]OGZ40212.1 MAG: 30S ribosomal protein S18 [Candidatus Portnoybacteria bacterium RIFCSPLOWO2_02_FULL_40_15]
MTKSCYFCQQKISEIDYQNTELLRQFISGQAKIISPKRTGTCAKHQRKIANAIKRARVMGLLPFTTR